MPRITEKWKICMEKYLPVKEECTSMQEVAAKLTILCGEQVTIGYLYNSIIQELANQMNVSKTFLLFKPQTKRVSEECTGKNKAQKETKAKTSKPKATAEVQEDGKVQTKGTAESVEDSKVQTKETAETVEDSKVQTKCNFTGASYNEELTKVNQVLDEILGNLKGIRTISEELLAIINKYQEGLK